MMKIAFCDDEAFYLTQITELLQEFSAQKEGISFSAFSSGEELLEAAEKLGDFDIYILDIVMPYLNGIQLGVHLRNKGFDGKIIYLTSSEEYAIDSFQARPFDYILKPLQKERFFTTLEEAIAHYSAKQEKSILVKTKESSIKLSFDSISYVELARRALVYHLVGGKKVESIQIRTTFSEAIQELLQDGRFVLCGASIAANLHHITTVEKDALIFKDGAKVYLPKRACAEIRSLWYDFWFDGEGSK